MDLRNQTKTRTTAETKAAIVEHCRTLGEKPLAVIYKEAVAAVERGSLPACTFSMITLWRWLAETPERSQEQVPSATVGGARLRSSAESSGVGDAALTSSASSASSDPANPQARLDKLAVELNKVGAAIQARGLSVDPSHAKVLKRLKRWRDPRLAGHEPASAEARRYSGATRSALSLIERYKSLLDASPYAASISTQHASTTGAPISELTEPNILAARGTATSSVAPSRAGAIDERRRRDVNADPRVSAMSPSSSDVELNGRELDQEQTAEIHLSAARFGSKLLQPQDNLTGERARMRAQIIGPVITGNLSAEKCAAMWREALTSRSPTPSMTALVAHVPNALREELSVVSARTIQRWAKKVRSARMEAKANNMPVPSVVTVLEHRCPRPMATRYKVTPAIAARIKDLFLHNPNFSQAVTAKHIRTELGFKKEDLSNRSVDRVIRMIPAAERLAARGGPEADNELRKTLERESPYPNRAWIMDHTFFKQELLNQEPDDDQTQFFYPVWYRRLAQGRPRLCDRVSATAIIDACTRRILAFRLWDVTPSTRETLTVLCEAMLRFGVPEILYTDNGADFRSKDVLRLLQIAGIDAVYSRPYKPRGRGKIEKWFDTLKSSLLTGVPGYNGGWHAVEHAQEDLFTLEQLQQHVWARVESEYNHAPHSVTKRKPAEHFDEAVRSLPLAAYRPAHAHRLFPLFVSRQATVQGSGIQHYGEKYYAEFLKAIPNRTSVTVHQDPLSLDVIHVSAINPIGDVVYLGSATSDKPSFDEQLRREQAWQEARDRLLSESQSDREMAQRREAARVAGADIGRTAALRAFAEDDAGQLHQTVNPPVDPPSGVSDLNDADAEPSSLAGENQAAPLSVPVVELAISPPRPDTGGVYKSGIKKPW